MNADDVAAYVGEQFQQRREESGLSRKELAHEIGISYNAIWMWETGRSSISLWHFMKMCLTLGVHPSVVLAQIEQDMILDF